METADILSIPLNEKIAHLLQLQKGQKVETVAVDDKYILIKVA